MANHNKNKKFGNGNFERLRKSRPVSQETVERQLRRKIERGNLRPHPENDLDLFLDYSENITD